MSGDVYYNRDVDRIIYNFGKSLRPSKNFVTAGKHLAHDVFLKLHDPKYYKVAEVRFAGSFGKDTAVIEPDLDLYVVVNDCEPSEDYEQLLEQFQRILEANCEELEIDPESIRGREKLDDNIPFNSIQFTFLNGIQVDLLPATFMDPDEVVEAIGQNPTAKNVNIYNTSFIRKILQFMSDENCDEFTRTLVRLSKFWLKSLSFGPDARVKGGSSLMEIVAFAAGQEETKKFGGENQRSILRAFERVIKMMRHLDTLKLVLEQDCQGKWHQVPEHRLRLASRSRYKKVLKRMVPDVVGFTKILRRKCFIVDPINPYCDRINDQQKNVLDQLMRYAKVTLERIERLKRCDPTICVMEMGDGGVKGQTVSRVLLTKLFKPQPRRLTSVLKAEVPSDYTFKFEDPDDDDDAMNDSDDDRNCDDDDDDDNGSYEGDDDDAMNDSDDDSSYEGDDDDDDSDEGDDLLITKVQFRNDEAKEDQAFRKLVEKVTWNIKATIHAAQGSFRNQSEVTVDNVKDAVVRLIEDNFDERTVSASDSDSDEEDRHEGMDVTVNIPFECPIGGDIHNVKLSMDN